MRNILAVVGFLIIGFYPCLARADTNQLVSSGSNTSIPDVNGWIVANISRIDLRVSDNIVAFLGLEVEYNNPANPKEFVRVIRRHIPLIISKQQDQNQQLFAEMIVAFYTQKEELDRLLEASDKSDPIIYTRWRTKNDPGTRTDMQDGDADIWFLSPSGDWLLVKNERMEVEFTTENVGNGKPHNVFAGMKYGIKYRDCGNEDDRTCYAYHIIRVDRNDLIKLFEGGGSHEKN